MDASEKLYAKWLEKVLSHPKKTLFFSLLFFGASFAIVKFLPKEMVPPQDTGSLMMRLKTKDGSSLMFTEGIVKKIEEKLKEEKVIKRLFVAIGGFGGGESNSAVFFVTLHPKKERPLDKDLKKIPTQLEYLQKLRDMFVSLEGGKVFVQDLSQGGFSGSGRGYPLEFSLMGPDYPTLIKSSKVMMEEMRNRPEFADVDTDFKESVKEIHFTPDRALTKQYGVPLDDVAQTISAMVGGVVVGKFSKEGHRNDIRLKMLAEKGTPLELVRVLRVRNSRGELIPLLNLVKIEEKPGTQSLTRKDRTRAIGIFSSIGPKSSQDAALEAVRELARKHLPENVVLKESGSSESMRETFRGLIFALILGIVVAYMILGSQFNSFLDPLIILMAMPFAFSGAFIGLKILGMSLNMYSFIGLILLMGIVKKNSILLVDFTKHYRAQGLSLAEALKAACPKRLRPILMTSVSTIAGAIPPAFSLGPGSEALAPMAVAIIGGTIVSTFLTLLVVPALYKLLAR
jgi:multidrug efflux pump subunit AcrB